MIEVVRGFKLVKYKAGEISLSTYPGRLFCEGGGIKIMKKGGFGMWKSAKVIILGIVFLLVCPLAHAGDESSEGDWELSLAPLYMWALNMNGDARIGPIAAPVDVGFGDIFDTLEFVFTAHFEALSKKQGGIFIDYSYVVLEEDNVTPGPIINTDTKMNIVELAGFYRFDKEPHGFDVFGGARIIDMDVEVDVVGRPLKVIGSQGWLDPMIGARWLWDMADKWKLSLRGDIGGFGVGSDFSWDLIGLIQYKPWEHVSIVGGYRVMDIDYEDDDSAALFQLDAQMRGPVFGLNIIW